MHEKEKHLNELTAKYEAEMADIRGKRKEVLLKAKEEAVDILDKSNRTIENTIRAKTVTYDFARLMEGATEIKCSEFGAAIARNM